ncbi:MAG: hypothetical protein KGZ25_06860 [Planctomycetes bacterium]|nr:hypothetical protein [Planctomycetota bacterium]
MKIAKENAEKSRERVEAWWNHEIIDRAVVNVTAPLKDADNEVIDEVEDVQRYFTDPEVVIPRTENRLANTYFGGEAFPVAPGVPTSFVAITASYLGCPVTFLNRSTVWCEPIIDDPNNLPDLSFNPDNKWWKASRHMMEAFVERADGYHVGIPDLNGPTELLARLRGTQKLALDFIDNPEYIKSAIDKITDAWYRYCEEAVKITRETGGYFYWMGIWSDRPSIDLQSDFSCMISPEQFREYFLPSIEKQTHMVERTIYHLDGPDAVRHLDALLELPDLDGIQWIPGAGAKPTVEWIPLLKRIQDGGKLVYVHCRPESIETLLDELRPEGLMMVTSCGSVEQAKNLLKNAEKWSAR